MVGDVPPAACRSFSGRGACSTDPYPHRGFPINVNFEFDICLAGSAHGGRVPSGRSRTDRPTRSPGSSLRSRGAGRCRNAPRTRERRWTPGPPTSRFSLDGNQRESGRGVRGKIVAGWAELPDPTLQHLNVTLDDLNVHDARDGGLTCSEDGELTFLRVARRRARTSGSASPTTPRCSRTVTAC